jgi:zinc-ribbon domain
MKCPSCGKQISDEALYCSQCGARLLPNKAQPLISNQSGGVNMNADGNATIGHDLVGRDKLEFHFGQETNFLHQIWDSLDPELQDALSLAYNRYSARKIRK